MIVVFDLGNSELKIGCFKDDKLIETFRTKSDRNKTCDEYVSIIKNLFINKGVDIKEVTGTILASVVPELTNELTISIERLFTKPLIVGPGIKTGVVLKCDNPNEVGSDIICGVVGAINKYNAPLLIVDLGTASKIIYVNKSKEFCGCIICPGMQVSSNILVSKASKLPEPTIDKPHKVIGKNTIDCMVSGIVNGHACMIDGLIERSEEEIKEVTTRIVTGGLSDLVSSVMKKQHVLDKSVVLEGLNILYKKNSDKNEK